jgi:site-specific recombinase XerD
MTIEQMCMYAEEFLEHLRAERNVSAHTYRAYQTDLKQFFLFWNKMQNNTAFTVRRVIERYLVSLFYKKIDNKTIARKFSCFSSFEKFLKQKSIILNLYLKRPKITRKLPIYLTIDEIFLLLDTVNNDQLPTKFPHRDRAIFELLYATGIRCSELAQITAADILSAQKSIRIFGKGKKERIVLYGSKAAKSMELYLTYERRQILFPDESFFLTNKGKPICCSHIRDIIIMFRKFLPIQRPLTPHKIRHSFATHLLQKGMDLRMIQELLGHKTLTSTEIYTHVSVEQLKKMCSTIHPLNKLSHKKPED